MHAFISSILRHMVFPRTLDAILSQFEALHRSLTDHVDLVGQAKDRAASELAQVTQEHERAVAVLANVGALLAK